MEHVQPQERGTVVLTAPEGQLLLNLWGSSKCTWWGWGCFWWVLHPFVTVVTRCPGSFWPGKSRQLAAPCSLRLLQLSHYCSFWDALLHSYTRDGIGYQELATEVWEVMSRCRRACNVGHCLLYPGLPGTLRRPIFCTHAMNMVSGNAKTRVVLHIMVSCMALAKYECTQS